MLPGKSSKKWTIHQVILWLLTILWLAVCLFLSWQAGKETGQLSQRIARFLLDLLGRLGLQPDAQQFHAGLRLFAHFGVFFVTGFLTSGALYVSLPRGKWIIALWIAVASCTLVAVLSEVGKLAVPGRHLTWSEAGLNLVGAIGGVLVVSGIRALANLFEGNKYDEE